jgi:glycosyltransferase involved in cell wall biosynthesis
VLVTLRIVVANKFWYRRGGQERVMLDEVAWLESAGHHVAHFSTQHPENDGSPWSDYFAPYLEIGVHSTLTTPEQVRAVRRMFWNQEAASRFARLLKDFQPDLIHVHGIHHQISPSILVEAKRSSVPIVQTLHDYHPICPAGSFLLGDGKECEPPRCGAVNVMPCALHACVHQSRARSLIAGVELFWRRWVMHYQSLVDAVICPSRYLASRVAADAFPNTACHILRNAVPDRLPCGEPSAAEEFVYAGRLSPEKGLPTLLRAAERAQVRLVIAGEGPISASLRRFAPQNVRFVGRISGEAVDRLLSECRAAVVPSEWAENAPMAVLEPMAMGRPIIATHVGGIPEQVRDGKEGILVRAGDDLELAAALRVLAEDSGLADRMGRAAHERVTALFSPQRHTTGLLDIYRSVLHDGRVSLLGAD